MRYLKKKLEEKVDEAIKEKIDSTISESEKINKNALFCN
jgi:hypothetical protein